MNKILIFLIIILWTPSFSQIGSGFKGRGLGTNKIKVDSIYTRALNVSDMVYPTTDGSDGYVLTTDGAGTLSFESLSGGAGGWTDDGATVRLTTIADNVGIGTATPSSKLHVVGGTAVDARFEDTAGAMKFGLYSAAGTDCGFNYYIDGTYKILMDVVGATDAWRVRNASAQVKLLMDQDGTFTFNSSSLADSLVNINGSLYVVNNIFAADTIRAANKVKCGAVSGTWSSFEPGDAALTASSSRNLKTNIIKLPVVELSKFVELPIYEYNFKREQFVEKFEPKYVGDWDSLTFHQQDTEKQLWLTSMNKRADYLHNKKHIGAMAEDFASLGGDGHCINYEHAFWKLWTVVQQQVGENQLLKEQIKQQNDMLLDCLYRLTQLEADIYGNDIMR